MCRRPASFGVSDSRERITEPTLVIHGEMDGIVPFEGSGRRTHAAVPRSERVVVPGGPHGLNVSHAEESTGRWSPSWLAD